ncbi:ATP-binding protein [Streptomyces sp. NPDC058467]|uniref:ATP-binding protein n=1 Tax=Streptomyces sp. NPDC058467 TaxID=3346513 RepID=UPI00365B6DDF
MSHLRAPAARADRREGGRHGRPVAHTAPSLPESHLRPQLLRLAVLPPTAVALSACAAVLFTVRSTGARPGLTLWAVLAGAVGVALAGILIAAVAADRAARSVRERIGALRRTSARTDGDLRALVEGLRRGETPPARKTRRQPPADADDFELLAADLSRAHDGAVAAVVQAAQLSSQAGSEQKVEVFVNLARRLQSLVHREISILDELENEIEDPDLLKGIFHIDHLATRIRRHAENLAVLGGAVSRRQWSNPVSMTEVLRSAIAEVEQYSRVKLVPPIDGTLRGHAVADVIHLLAELVENATVFSAPHTQVLLRVNLVTSGLAVEVEDRGLGMPLGEQNKMNALLTDPDQVNVASLLQDGRIGLFVVSQLARRHGIHVRLQSNIYGGVQAVLVVPQGLLGNAPGTPGNVAQGQPPETSGGRRPQPRPQATQAASAPASPGGHASAPVPRQVRRDQAPYAGAPGALPGEGSGPAPLPVRGTHPERPNPAEALPGIRAEDRRTARENAAAPPTPRGGAVRGTMGKPQLPRRRAQEHIAPQLREGPAPRQDTEYVVGHDPGLMAAFQRGIGLAEAAHAETERMRASSPVPPPATSASPMSASPTFASPTSAEPNYVSPPSASPTSASSTSASPTSAEPNFVSPTSPSSTSAAPAFVSPTSSSRTSAAPGDRAHLGLVHMDELPPLEVVRVDAPHGDVTYPDGAHADAAHIADPHTAHAPAPHEADGARDTRSAPHEATGELDSGPAPHQARGTRDSAPAPGHDLTARHDGSTPAG